MDFDFTRITAPERYRLLTNFIGPRPIAQFTTRSDGQHNNAAPMLLQRLFA